jgi:type I restriction enzyme S subunit
MYWSIVNSTIAYPKYLYLYLSLLDLSAKDSGSTLPSMTFDSYYSVPVKLPELKTQVQIADKIFSITNKININNKINAELESMIKTLYDYWFLQFEFPNEEGKPYKSSGGKMVWNEKLKREIPFGWKSITLSDIIKKMNRKYDYSIINRTYDLSVMDYNTISIYKESSSKDFDTNLFSVKKGDLLFGSIRPYLRKAGIAAYDGAVTGTVHCFEIKNSFDFNLALMTITSENFFEYAINNSKGTKMPVVS